jgi:pyruvate dehydrogenase E2 component (dihydrolipoamide acetyltransferase)
MATVVEARVPDIGSHGDVPVIELLVAVGDTVRKDQGLVTLESDKATMEVPASTAGIVRELKVKLGDAVSEGAVVALIEVADSDAATPYRLSLHGLPPVCRQRRPQAPLRRPVARRPTHPAPPRPWQMAIRKPSRHARRPSCLRCRRRCFRPIVPHASPAVRLYARELGVDLGKVPGQGRKGRITREDVNAFVKATLAARV